jgi:osmotically inducible protein OsmC
MAMAERNASATWEGDLGHGRGTVTASSSGAFGPLDVTWASRTERSGGLTSPEELIAAAHASCFAMALSHGLAEDGHTPERVEVEARVTLDEVDGGPKVTASHLTVRGRVPGIDAHAFRAAAEAAKDGCPVSGALKGNLELSVEAELEGG